MSIADAVSGEPLVSSPGASAATASSARKTAASATPRRIGERPAARTAGSARGRSVTAVI